MSRLAVLIGGLALVLGGCGTGAKTTPATASNVISTAGATLPASATSPVATTAAGSQPPAGTATSSGLHVALAGKDLCDYLTPADFRAAGVTGASKPSENNTAEEFYCVYDGDSSATGGIELDAFVYNDLDDQDIGYDSLLPADDQQDVTAQVPKAEAAVVGTASSGGPRFAAIAVRAGNLIYGIGIPPTDNYQAELVELANDFMSRVEALASPSP
jgi:hypothetical protein